ncbi:MAG TPA: hypothetical protein VF838_02945 [Trebonia sp.]
MAVIKCTWADTAWDGARPAAQLYSDEVINRLFLPNDYMWGIASFWQNTSFGSLDLTGSEVFPWVKLGLPTPAPGAAPIDRGTVAQAGLAAAQRAGFPLDDFQGLIFWVVGGSPQDGGASPSRLAGRWAFATLYEAAVNTVYCHEYGHAMGFRHSWGPGVSIASDHEQPYYDPYDMMSAQTFGGQQASFGIRADPLGPPGGATDPFYTAVGPMPAMAELYNEIPDFAKSANVLDLGVMDSWWDRSFRLRARDLGAGTDPVLAIARSADGASGDRLAFLVELCRTAGYDRAYGIAVPGAAPAGVVVHSFINLREYPTTVQDFDGMPKVAYEGNIPAPLTPGRSWDAATAKITIRVTAATADMSTVDLSITRRPVWLELDDNPATVQIVAGADGRLFQRHQDGSIWAYTGTPHSGWLQLDNNRATATIITDGGSELYQLHANGEIYRYNGTPITGWDRLDANPATVEIAASGTRLYQRHADGRIWRYDGSPNWTELDNNPHTAQIIADGYDLYQRHDDGSIFRYTGTPYTGWEQLDNNPDTAAIAASGDSLYQLHRSGAIYHYNGTPMTGWDRLDANPATAQLVVSGVLVCQRHADGSIFHYAGTPYTGWRQDDDNPQTADITVGGGQVYQLHRTGRIWQYLG